MAERSGITWVKVANREVAGNVKRNSKRDL